MNPQYKPRYKPHKLADVISAWAYGYEIQQRPYAQEHWTDVRRPMWYADVEYRIKPQDLTEDDQSWYTRFIAIFRINKDTIK